MRSTSSDIASTLCWSWRSCCCSSCAFAPAALISVRRSTRRAKTRAKGPRMKMAARMATKPMAVSCAILASGSISGGRAALVMTVRSPCLSTIKRPPPTGMGGRATGAWGATGALGVAPPAPPPACPVCAVCAASVAASCAACTASRTWLRISVRTASREFCIVSIEPPSGGGNKVLHPCSLRMVQMDSVRAHSRTSARWRGLVQRNEWRWSAGMGAGLQPRPQPPLTTPTCTRHPAPNLLSMHPRTPHSHPAECHSNHQPHPPV